MCDRTNRLFLVAGPVAMILGLLMSATVSAQTAEIDGEVLRDPTMPFSAVDRTTPPSGGLSIGGLFGGADTNVSRVNYSVSFVRSGGANPVAVINNTTVKVGDEVNGALVIAINDGSVTLSINGQERVLSTHSRPVRQEISVEQ